MKHTDHRLSGGPRQGRGTVLGRGVLAAALAVTLGFTAPLGAQQTGQVAGTVVDQASGQALTSVQVFIPGAGIGGLTGPGGRFLLLNVPVGEHEVRAERIGYAAASQQVTITPGETATLQLRLGEAALGLDEIVVTGTAGAARRREVGNSVSQINLDDQIQLSSSVEGLLQGQAPGVTILEGSGSAGSGAQIRLRGNVSVSMSNQPLIYVDGVRMRSDGLPSGIGPEDGSNGSNTVVGPLAGINPADIDRIEVVRGPAATALYGTEAAAGVMQIFTKRGQSGAARWTAQIDQGGQWSRKFGTDRHPYMRMDPWLRTGHTQRYRASVSGGSDDARYLVSGTYGDAEGALPNDYETTYQLRTTLDFQPLEDLSVAVTASVSRDDILNTYSGNSALGLTLNVFRCDFDRNVVANYIGSCDRDQIDRLLEYQVDTRVDRLTSGVTFRHTPFEWLSNRLTIGYDRISSDARNLRPFGSVGDPEGSISTVLWANDVLTADYATTAEIGLGSDLSADLTIGGQLTERQEHEFGATGRRLPGPGEPTVANAAEVFNSEERFRVITGGLFAQSVFDFRDRYFLTLGARVDGNSAFGSDFGLETYPRASASYVVSEEPFWPSALGTVKLRAAIGYAGRAPGAFDAVRTWNPVPWVEGASAFEPENVGNPDLGPERTREFEVGFDAALLNQRLDVIFTYYDQRTEDALVQVRRPPSQGFQGSQLQNVGSFATTGIELALAGNIIQTPDYGWDVGVDISTNNSDVLDLGGSPAFSVGGGGWVEEGEPLPVIKGWRITNENEFAEPDISENEVFGPNMPTHTIGVNTQIHLPYNLRVSARGEYLGGHYMREALTDLLVYRETSTLCDGITQDLETNRDAYTAKWRALCDPALSWYEMFIYPADYFRFRDLSLQAPVGFAIPGVADASLTLSLRNFWTWKNDDFLTFDPEIVGQGGMDRVVREVNESIPPLKSFTASLRITF